MWSINLCVIVCVLQCILPPASSQEFVSCRNPFNQSGICINIRRCGPLLNLLQTQGLAAGEFLRASVCGFEGSDPRVCCPTGDGDGGDTRDSKEVVKTEYGPLAPPNCGFSDAKHNRVVGGEPAVLGAWPWITALGYVNKKDPNRPRWLCGGALISSRHVLTAGHCVHRRDDLYVVRIGDLDLNTDRDGATTAEVLIEKKTIHPDYSPTSYTNDVAVLRLQQEVPFSRNLHPICLPASDEIRTMNLDRKTPFVAGWGSVYFNGPSSNRLMEVQLPVVNNEDCKAAFRNFKTTVIDNRVICAGYATGGKDACQGDSGGPLMYPRGKYFYLIGVVSYGFRCAEPGYPGVYTRVTEFLDFIARQLV